MYLSTYKTLNFTTRLLLWKNVIVVHVQFKRHTKQIDNSTVFEQ